MMTIDLEKIKEVKSMPELLKFSIINLDKPSGPTSFTVSQFVKNILGVKKTGHFGTLDPQVTGVLPVGLGSACRLNNYFTNNKEYVGIMRLHSDVSTQVLKNAVKKFIGKIMQLPPVRSRVKREVREREIISFDILEHEGKDVLFKTEVQAGTYIRKLIHDLGEQIGGAHMLELRRTKAGIFYEENSVNLYDFEKAVTEYKKGNEESLRSILIPSEIISQILPVVQAEESSLKQLLVGKPLTKNDINGALPDEEKFVLFNKNRFIGVYRKSKEGDIIARPEFVFN